MTSAKDANEAIDMAKDILSWWLDKKVGRVEDEHQL